MNRTQQHSSLPASEGFTLPITLPRVPGFAEAPYQMLAGKLTRLLARNVPTKKLTMRNMRPLVSFTFDDAAATACTAGAALLEQFHARGTDRNRSFLQGILGDIPIGNFAYPYGDVSFATKRCLSGCYDSCRALTPGVNADVADLGVLKSNALEQSSIGRQGVSHLIAETVRRNGWLLFASHDVNDVPSQYGVRPELLTFALRGTLAAGCRIVTVARALRSLRGEEPDGEAA
jgi:hypothetical protein